MRIKKQESLVDYERTKKGMKAKGNIWHIWWLIAWDQMNVTLERVAAIILLLQAPVFGIGLKIIERLRKKP